MTINSLPNHEGVTQLINRMDTCKFLQQEQFPSYKNENDSSNDFMQSNPATCILSVCSCIASRYFNPSLPVGKQVVIKLDSNLWAPNTCMTSPFLLLNLRIPAHLQKLLMSTATDLKKLRSAAAPTMPPATRHFSRQDGFCGVGAAAMKFYSFFGFQCIFQRTLSKKAT